MLECGCVSFPVALFSSVACKKRNNSSDPFVTRHVRQIGQEFSVAGFVLLLLDYISTAYGSVCFLDQDSTFL